LNGSIFIYSNNSQDNDIETGLNVTRILSILCNRKIGHLVICLDLCRTSNRPVSFKDKFVSELKKFQSKFSSLIILTRVLVSNILGALGAGDTVEEILEDYPNITRDDISAALTFGGKLAQFEELSYEAAIP